MLKETEYNRKYRNDSIETGPAKQAGKGHGGMRTIWGGRAPTGVMSRPWVLTACSTSRQVPLTSQDAQVLPSYLSYEDFTSKEEGSDPAGVLSPSIPCLLHLKCFKGINTQQYGWDYCVFLKCQDLISVWDHHWGISLELILDLLGSVWSCPTTCTENTLGAPSQPALQEVKMILF